MLAAWLGNGTAKNEGLYKLQHLLILALQPKSSLQDDGVLRWKERASTYKMLSAWLTNAAAKII